jgi:DNA polymerase-3 subunit gamma/tau
MPAPEAALRELTRYASRLEPILGSLLGRSQARMHQGMFEITFPASPTASSHCTAENQTKLEGFLGELFSNAPRVSLQAAAAPPERPADAVSQAELASNLAEHPAVQEAVEVFEAQVVALNPSGPEDE